MLVETDLPNLFNRGKVRDTYDLGSGLLLMVATDRISAYDVVLPDGIPLKGMVLARMSAFWFKTTSHIVPNHTTWAWPMTRESARSTRMSQRWQICNLR